ncbi:unnamed protein product [Auanema sp. JU1783]|nr:unnamed protein product [Auanema sp. JU1783]
MTNFAGRWKLDKSDKFDEYMAEVGVGLLTRKAAATLKPTLVIKIDGDHWSCNQESTFKNTTLEFNIGEEFDETTPDGRKMKSKVELVNGKLIHQQKAIKSGEKDSSIERWLEGDRLITTLTSGNVVCRREYVRE